MKVGDLIRFMPNWVRTDWTSPAVVIERYPPPDEELWVVYRDGRIACSLSAFCDCSREPCSNRSYFSSSLSVRLVVMYCSIGK